MQLVISCEICTFFVIAGEYIKNTGTFNGAGDAHCVTTLLNGYMTRRTIALPIVRIHTADDDYLQANAASLHEANVPLETWMLLLREDALLDIIIGEE